MQNFFKSEKFTERFQISDENHVVIPYRCQKALSPAKGYIAFKNRVDFTCNPYYGCLYNCKYCFVPKSLAYNHLTIGRKNWGKWILPKVNYPKLLENELRVLEEKNQLNNTVLRLSSISDPFPPVEPKFLLTKKTLLKFLKYTPKWIFIQTKSNLILKYFSLLKELKDNIAIAISISTNRDDIIKIFEPYSPTFDERLKILERFKKNGFYTQAVIAPILPQDPEFLAEKLKMITDRVILKSFYDDGKMGRNLRSIGKEFINRKGYEFVFDKNFLGYVEQLYIKILGKNHVSVGKEGFIRFP